MKAALHYADFVSPPLGVWWFDPEAGYVQHYYVDMGSPYVIRGRVLMYSKVATCAWGQYFTQLAGRHPYLDVWEAADIGDMWAPRQYLHMMRDIAQVLLDADH